MARLPLPLPPSQYSKVLLLRSASTDLSYEIPSLKSQIDSCRQGTITSISCGSRVLIPEPCFALLVNCISHSKLLQPIIQLWGIAPGPSPFGSTKGSCSLSPQLRILWTEKSPAGRGSLPSSCKGTPRYQTALRSSDRHPFRAPAWQLISRKHAQQGDGRASADSVQYRRDTTTWALSMAPPSWQSRQSPNPGSWIRALSTLGPTLTPEEGYATSLGPHGAIRVPAIVQLDNVAWHCIASHRIAM